MPPVKTSGSPYGRGASQFENLWVYLFDSCPIIIKHIGMKPGVSLGVLDPVSSSRTVIVSGILSRPEEKCWDRVSMGGPKLKCLQVSVWGCVQKKPAGGDLSEEHTGGNYRTSHQHQTTVNRAVFLLITLSRIPLWFCGCKASPNYQLSTTGFVLICCLLWVVVKGESR